MPKQKPSAGASERVRSAITGRFVKKSAAKRSPRTTVIERFKRSTGRKK